MGSVYGVIAGHALLALCAALYLTWWAIFFRPKARPSGLIRGVGVACIVGAAATGLGGVGAAGWDIARIAGTHSISGWAFVIAAVLAYAVLALSTRCFFERPVTTELLLIVAWCVFELWCVATLSKAGMLAEPWPTIFSGAVLVFSAINLVCCVLYYRLPPAPAFIDGTAPLILAGIAAVMMVAVLL